MGEESRSLAVLARPVLPDLRLRDGTNRHAALQNTSTHGLASEPAAHFRAVSERLGANVNGE